MDLDQHYNIGNVRTRPVIDCTVRLLPPQVEGVVPDLCRTTHQTWAPVALVDFGTVWEMFSDGLLKRKRVAVQLDSVATDEKK